MNSTCKTVQIGEETVRFPRLNLEEINQVADDIVSRSERVIREVAGLEKLDKVDVANLVLDARRNRPQYRDIVAYSYSPDGAACVLHHSLRKGGYNHNQAKALIAEMPTTEAMSLAEMLVLDQQEPEKERKPEDDEKNSSSPDQKGDAGTQTSASSPDSAAASEGSSERPKKKK